MLPTSTRVDSPRRGAKPTPDQLWQVLRASAASWLSDGAPSMGAAIAYYTALSLAPLLLIVVSVAGLFYGQEAATGALFDQLKGMVGNDGALAVQTMLAGASNVEKGQFSVIAGSVMLVIGATTVFAELQADLDRIWKAPPAKGSSIWLFLRTRLLSFGLVVGVGFLLLVSLVASAAITALGELWGTWLDGRESIAAILNFIFSVAIITVLFALIYKSLPSTPIGWQDVWVGAFVTSWLFSVGKYLIGLYLGTSAISSTFGAAGAFVVLMVWIYYAAQVFLLGAEFTHEYAVRYGSLSHLPPARTSQDPA